MNHANNLVKKKKHHEKYNGLVGKILFYSGSHFWKHLEPHSHNSETCSESHFTTLPTHCSALTLKVDAWSVSHKGNQKRKKLISMNHYFIFFFIRCANMLIKASFWLGTLPACAQDVLFWVELSHAWSGPKLSWVGGGVYTPVFLIFKSIMFCYLSLMPKCTQMSNN